MSEPLTLRPISFRSACDFIGEHHRHHRPPVGWKFGIAASIGDRIVGVTTVGRPVARAYDDGLTLEVNRCCTDGTKNACSMLYAAAWRAVKAMGYRRIITYTLESESGVSLRAAGWTMVHLTRGGTWDCPSRPRADKAPTCRKVLWEKRF